MVGGSVVGSGGSSVVMDPSAGTIDDTGSISGGVGGKGVSGELYSGGGVGSRVWEMMYDGRIPLSVLISDGEVGR